MALGVSFICSIMEAVLLSVTPSYVALLAQQEHPQAKTLHALKQDVDQPLGAILTLNTIAHTIGAAGAGAEAEKVFGGGTPTLIFAGVLTLLILIASEIIPKTLGAIHWKKLTPSVVRLLNFAPMRWLGKMSQGITRFFFSDKKVSRISREEFSALAEIGRQEGVFQEDESTILKNLLRFDKLVVKDVMTPRTVVFALPATWTVKEVINQHEDLVFSRIPIYDNNRDEVTGYVMRRDILMNSARDEHDVALNEFKRDFLVVQQDSSLQRLFEQLLAKQEHIALVIDEYGGMAGLATMEDIVETLLGLEIVDEADTVQDMQELARRRWAERARRIGLIKEKEEE